MASDAPIDFRNHLRRTLRDRLSSQAPVVPPLIIRTANIDEVKNDLKIISSSFGLRHIAVDFNASIPGDLTELLALNQRRMVVMTRAESLAPDDMLTLPDLFAQAGRTMPIFLEQRDLALTSA